MACSDPLLSMKILGGGIHIDLAFCLNNCSFILLFEFLATIVSRDQTVSVKKAPLEFFFLYNCQVFSGQAKVLSTRFMHSFISFTCSLNLFNLSHVCSMDRDALSGLQYFYKPWI